MKIINVTQEDIDKGIRGQSDKCPVSRVARRIANKKRVRMGLATLYINKKPFRVPQVVTTFVHKFDCGESVKPFTFNI